MDDMLRRLLEQTEFKPDRVGDLIKAMWDTMTYDEKSQVWQTMMGASYWPKAKKKTT